MSYKEMVNEYLTRFGEHVKVEFAPLDEEGYTSVKRGSATVGINVMEGHGVLMLLAPIMAVPKEGANDLYRKLLELNFLATSDAAFAIDKDKEIIYLRALRGLEGLDYEEFVDLLGTVGRIADEWDDKLHHEFGE